MMMMMMMTMTMMMMMMMMMMKINRCNPLCELQRKIRRYIYPHSDSEIGEDDNIDQRKSHHHHDHGAGWHRHHHDHGAAGWPSLASHIGSGYLAERVYSANLILTTIMMSRFFLRRRKKVNVGRFCPRNSGTLSKKKFFKP